MKWTEEKISEVAERVDQAAKDIVESRGESIQGWDSEIVIGDGWIRCCGETTEIPDDWTEEQIEHAFKACYAADIFFERPEEEEEEIGKYARCSICGKLLEFEDSGADWYLCADHEGSEEAEERGFTHNK